MLHKIFSGLAAATLSVVFSALSSSAAPIKPATSGAQPTSSRSSSQATLSPGATSLGFAQSSSSSSQSSPSRSSSSSSNSSSSTSTSVNSLRAVLANSGQLNPNPPTGQNTSQRFTADSSGLSAEDAVKVGEQAKPQALSSSTASVAKIYSHLVDGRRAATLYVKNIPFLTFIGSTPTPPTDAIKVGIQTERAPQIVPARAVNQAVNQAVARAGASDASPALLSVSQVSTAIAKPNVALDLSSDDPVWKATQVAAQLNQLNRDGFDAKTITVKPAAAKGNQPVGYRIQVGDKLLATLDANTVLADSTQDPTEDALQAANRLRRLMGGAEALQRVEGQQIQLNSAMPAVGNVLSSISGYASWYGPGFDGNPCANGETFNQYALTAAHRQLPFGTKVRVTNLSNGRSVVVRINDRGPYAGDRILDLSRGAADAIGLISSGVGMVRLDVLGNEAAGASTAVSAR